MNLWIRCTRYFLLSTSNELDDLYNILQQIILNIISHPEEIKYQEIKLTNKIIKERILNRNGGIEFMQAIGFQIIQKDNIKIFQFSNLYLNELSSSLEWLSETLTTCKSARSNLQPNEPCCDGMIQIRFPNGTTAMGGFFPQEKFEEILNFAKSFFSEEMQPYVSLRLPHLASTASILAPDLTIEELGLSPRATLIVTTLNDDERNEILQQKRILVNEEIQTNSEMEKLARQKKLFEQEARRKAKEDVLRAFQEDRERHKNIR